MKTLIKRKPAADNLMANLVLLAATTLIVGLVLYSNNHTADANPFASVSTMPLSNALDDYFGASLGGGNEAKVFGLASDNVMDALDNLSVQMPGNSAHTFTLGVPAYEAKKHLCPSAPDTIGDGTVVLNYGGFVPESPVQDRWEACVYIEGSKVRLFMTR